MSGYFGCLRERISYQSAMLGFLCALVATLLMLGYRTTEASISARLDEDRAALLNQVLDHSHYDNQPLQERVEIDDARLSATPVGVYLARSGGRVSAVVYQIETLGYGGPIAMMIALDTKGRILGLRCLSHKETPGLADKIDKAEWLAEFKGASLENTSIDQWKVKKDGGKFDQFTGATITPRAVVKGVVAALHFYARHAGELEAK